MGKKSNHKHEYELIKIEDKQWYTHAKICKICGHVYTRLRINRTEEEEKECLEKLNSTNKEMTHP